MEMPEKLLVAVGGNAIHPGSIEGTAEEQAAIAAQTADQLLPLMQIGKPLIITHGNGPVVGKILMRQALSRDHVPPMPMDICVAHSQGGIAYLLMQACENALRRVNDPRHVACLLTQVEVDPEDPAFSNPQKPIGFFYSPEEAQALEARFGWTMREDAGRGWRYVVPSPTPRHIVDISLLQTVADSGAVVIAGGGGGIAVSRSPSGERHGLNAVIDKDLTSALMANVLNIKVMMLLTGVDAVQLDYGTPAARDLGEVGADEMRRLMREGHFAEGSMEPKIDAALRFIEGGGERVVIANLNRTLPALRGECGTHITAR